MVERYNMRHIEEITPFEDLVLGKREETRA